MTDILRSTPPAWHALTPQQVLEVLDASLEGLRSEQADVRLQRYGKNELPVAPPTPWWRMFLRQFISPLIAILAIAATITAVQQHWVDTGAIVIVLLINASLGFWQESKSERDVRALQSLSTPNARAVRNGVVAELSAAELVVGDIVLLESGDRVPADLRLCEVNGLRIDESMLTGESLAAAKSADQSDPEAALGDREGSAFSGTLVTSGRGTGVVVATGRNTELGAIAKLIEAPNPPTPLQRLTNSLERRIGIAVIIAAIAVFAIGLLTGQSVAEMFRVAVALAVSAIPESLPIILTVAMSVGVSRMAKRGAIVRTLPSVETLGSTTVIASDKTGTLTQNRLTVERLWTYTGEHDVDAPLDEVQRETLRAGALTNEARTSPEGELTGDAVDVAMASAAFEARVVSREEFMSEPATHMPYEPALRHCRTVRVDAHGQRVVYVKGSPDTIAAMCATIATPEGPVPMDLERVLAANEALGKEGLRVIATAERVLREDDSLEASDGLVFLGLEGMTDPPRAGVRQAIVQCRDAGIAVRMITGDHPVTAAAIANRLGLPGDAEPLTGHEMKELDDAALYERLMASSVAARVDPRDKLRIVQTLQEHGETVAVTGDGVNDAPALKAATIGVAMGKEGTDVAREAADVVLTDDNFVTIVDAVEQGRVTFAAIRKATFFLLSTAVAMVLCFGLNVLFDQPLVMLPVQILFVNLVTSGFQDIALALEPAEGDELKRQPRSASEGVLSRVLWWRTLFTGVWMGLIVLAVFSWAIRHDYGIEHARSLAMTAFVLFNFFQIGNARAEHRSSLLLHPMRNPVLLLTSVGAIALLWAVMTWQPSAQLFGITSLSLLEWVTMFAIASSVFVISEADKAFRSRRAMQRQ